MEQNDWCDYIAQRFEVLASVLALYGQGAIGEKRMVRLRIHPDIHDVLRRTFQPGTFANPDLTDEEWTELEAEWEEEKDEER